MKKLSKKLWSAALSVVLAAGLVSPAALAYATEGTSSAGSEKLPVIAGIESSLANNRTTPAGTNGAIGGGEQSTDIPTKSIHDGNYDGLSTLTSLPSSYNSADKGLVTPVGNQGDFGTCWAFATTAACESSILSEGLADSVDLSERHLSYWNYHRTAEGDPLGGTKGDSMQALTSTWNDWFESSSDPYLGAGSNSLATMFTLASWYGAADESKAEYQGLFDAYPVSTGPGYFDFYDPEKVEKFLADTALDDSTAYDDSYHLENCYRISSEDRDDIKQAVMNYGACAASLKYDYWEGSCDSYYSYENNALYNWEAKDTNHEVSIVGWDDNYDAENFSYDDGWDEASALSAPEISLNSSVSVECSEEGIAWAKFTPQESGYYDGLYGVDVYRIDPNSGHRVIVNRMGDYFCLGNPFLEKGTTYYLAYSNHYSWNDSKEHSFNVSKSDVSEYLSKTAVALDQGIKTSINGDASDYGYAVKWLSFTPTDSGLYTLSFDTADYVLCSAIALNGLDGNGSFECEMCDMTGTFEMPVYMSAGQTYLLKFELYPQDEEAGLGENTVEVNLTEKMDDSIHLNMEVGLGLDIEATQPSGNGAWLCKNSWGTEENDEGYFWLSYYDSSFNLEGNGVCVFDLAEADNYDNNYQYDGTTNAVYNTLPSGGSIANVFTAKANADGGESLDAVSFALFDTNVDYSIQVYVNPTDADNPSSGSPVLSSPVTGKTTYQGYYTVELPQPVSLTEGMTYAVALTLSHNDGSRVMYAVDSSTDYWGYVHHTAACEEGQSFSQKPGESSWYDLSGRARYEGDEPGATARIKAFTTNTETVQQLSIPISQASVTVTGVTDTDGVKTPIVEVSYGGAVLTQDVHYKVDSTYDADAHTVNVTVSGMGIYTGETEATYIVEESEGDDPTGEEPGDDPSGEQPGEEPGDNTGDQMDTQTMFRLYNPNSGEHFYTASAGERDMLKGLGWNDEGTGWIAPTSGDPVYRLYNPNAGEHHYTTNASEKAMLERVGWNYEGVGWYSGGDVRLYREYNPNAYANNHNYTTNKGEHDWLLSLGWNDEGFAWNAVSAR